MAAFVVVVDALVIAVVVVIFILHQEDLLGEDKPFESSSSALADSPNRLLLLL